MAKAPETALERLERRRREREADQASNPVSAESSATEQVPTLVVVDDEALNLDVLRRQFQGSYTVESFDSGEAALSALNDGLKAEIFLSDQRMPGMSGVEFLSRVAEILPRSRRLVLSGYTDRQDLLAAINGGHVHRYITKPWQADELAGLLADALVDYRAAEAVDLERLRVQRRKAASLAVLLVVSIALAVGWELQRRRGVVEVIPDDVIVLGTKNIIDRVWVDTIPDEALSATNPNPSGPDAVALGRERYESVCVGCHGNAADGNGAIARLFGLPVPELTDDGDITLPDAAFAWVTAHGIDGTAMKSMESMLQPGDPWAIVSYLKHLAEEQKNESMKPDEGADSPSAPVTGPSSEAP